MTEGEAERAGVRLALPAEAVVLADLWLRSRRASIPANPPPVHDDEDVRRHFSGVVLPEMDVWVIDGDGAPVALMALQAGWVEHLHVEPALTGRGLGSRLIGWAKARHSDGLELWTFQANSGARRFYERHDFVVVAMTDGDNEEGAPDVRYRWTPSAD